MKKFSKSKLLAVGAAFLVGSLFSGCASPAQPEAMVPTAFNVKSRHLYTTELEVSGGKKTNPMWKSDIAGEDFEKAVESAIMKSGVFSSVITTGDADYRLEITLVKTMTPNFGLDLTSTVVTEWRLTDLKSNELVLEEYITSEFTATVGDAFAAIKRLRLANEGSARENIKEGIKRISEVEIPEKKESIPTS